MTRMNVKLNSVDKVKSFVDIVSRYPVDMDLVNGRYVIDAKSIMGIFSLDLSKTLELTINSSDSKLCDSIMKSVSMYQV